MLDSVMKLTSPPRRRQSSVVYRVRRRLARALPALGALVAFAAPASEVRAGVAWQPAADIAAAAEDFLRSKTGADAGRTTVRAGTLDPRHRLHLCDAELEAFMRRGTKITARTIVGVRCSGSRPWKVYVPVDVIVTAPVVTARRTLPRGHLVAAGDLTVAERDVSRMLSGYYSDPAELSGQRLTQQLLAGRIITPNMLEADRIVSRGQTVTLVAKSAGVSIRMAGKALTDGALNQRIRVENLNSGRVVEGIVRSREHVEVLVASTGRFSFTSPKVSASDADKGLTNNDR